LSNADPRFPLFIVKIDNHERLDNRSSWLRLDGHATPSSRFWFLSPALVGTSACPRPDQKQPEHLQLIAADAGMARPARPQKLPNRQSLFKWQAWYAEND